MLRKNILLHMIH